MIVILVLQIRKIVGLTGQLLFCTTRVLQVNWTVRTSFIVYTIYSYSFFYLILLISLLWDIIQDYGLQLYQSDPRLKKSVLLRFLWVQLLIQETSIFKDILQCKALDEDHQLLTKFVMPLCSKSFNNTIIKELTF